MSKRRHQSPDEAHTIEQLIERSSLGTREAVRLRRQAPNEVVQSILDRMDALDMRAMRGSST